MLFDKLGLLYRTSLCFVMLAVKSIRRKTNKLVSKHTKQEIELQIHTEAYISLHERSPFLYTVNLTALKYISGKPRY